MDTLDAGYKLNTIIVKYLSMTKNVCFKVLFYLKIQNNMFERFCEKLILGRVLCRGFSNNWLILDQFILVCIYQDLSYDESLSGRPGAWLEKKIFFICMQSQILKKDLILKFKIISRTSFVFIIAFMVYE